MSKNSFVAAFRYMFKDMLASVGVICAIMLVLYIGMNIVYYSSAADIVADGAQVGIFGAFEFAAMVMMLVIGIVSVREDTRMLLQNGVGRHTAYKALLAVCAVGSLLLACGGQLLLTLANAVSSDASYFINGFYYMLFELNPPGELTVIMNLLLSFTGYLLSALAGMMISMIFYRLPRFWCIAVAVGAPLLLFIGLPLSVSNTGLGVVLERSLGAVITRMLGAPSALLLGYAIMAVIAALAAKLLLRHAPLK